VLFAAETWPFTIATFLMLLIAIVEGIAMVIGASLSESLQHALPISLDHVDGSFDKLLGWLHIGRVPMLVLLVLFLSGFALTGFALNIVAHRLIGTWVPSILSVPTAFLATLPVVRILGAGIAHLIPNEQSFAVSFSSLIGRPAVVVSGTARQTYPAQARVRSEHGQTIYVMVEPDAPGMTFQPGERIVLTRQLSGSRFQAAIDPWPELAGPNL
jgi:hypothetical protein